MLNPVSIVKARIIETVMLLFKILLPEAFGSNNSGLLRVYSFIVDILEQIKIAI